MQSSLPAGWLAFTGRELNPLDHYKRFPISHPPFLDLSWRKGSFIVCPSEDDCVRRSGITEYLIAVSSGSICADAREPHYLGPLLGVFRKELTEVGRRT